MKKLFVNWKQDLPAGLVVFLVALPLCLGVGLASTTISGDDVVLGTPNIFSGILAGIIGGVVVGFFSGSRLGVSGPAAGLITIVLASLSTLGSFEAFLTAVVLAGLLQFIAGYAKLGFIGSYFPSSVIKGMLAAIGITLILKEIPHAVGYDKDFFGDESFNQAGGENTYTSILHSFGALQMGAAIISILSLAILILLERPFFKKLIFFKYFPSALVVVLLGIGMTQLFKTAFPAWILTQDHLVTLPVATNAGELLSSLKFPDFNTLMDFDVYKIALTIALVASLETLLSVEATDKLDPLRWQTPTNKELKAQGIGNMVSGLIGGLPITQVIVRSSANINANAKSKLSTIFHGLLLALTVVFIPRILNMIPLASLAAILLMIGYKLTKISIFVQLYKIGVSQFLPFIATIIGVLLSDLLTGIGIGLVISVFFILKRNFDNNYRLTTEEHDGQKVIKIILSQEVTFLNKASLIDRLNKIPRNSKVFVDGSHCHEIDYDVIEAINEFVQFTAKNKSIDVVLHDI